MGGGGAPTLSNALVIKGRMRRGFGSFLRFSNLRDEETELCLFLKFS
jgi:hypothetical protein